jgi:hypothetical protein
MKIKKLTQNRLLCGSVCAGTVIVLAAWSAPAQNLFVSGGSGNIYEYTPGGVQSTFANNYAGAAYSGLAFDSAGDLFVGDNHNGAIYEFKPGYIAGQTPITFASGLPGVTGLAFNSTGNLFVAIGADGNNIYEYTPGGVQSTFTTGLPDVEGLAFNSAGDLFAAGSVGPNNVTEITPGGVQSTLPITGLNGPGMIAFNSAGDLFVANNFANNIIEYSHNGVQSTFASGLGNPYGLAFNSSGILFEGDANTATINRFTPGGVESPFVTGSGTGALGWMTMQPVPEPSAFGLFGVGLAALLMLRRKYFSH